MADEIRIGYFLEDRGHEILLKAFVARVAKEKGLVRIKLVSKSWAAAGERTGSGENALEMLIDDFVKLRTYFIKSAPEHPHRALILKSIQAESNQRVPQSAEALLEIRYAATDDMERLFEKLQTEFNSEIIVESIQPLFSSGESPHLNLLLDIAKDTASLFYSCDN